MSTTALLGLFLASAWAGPQRQAVLDLLNAYDEPVRPADLAALGDGVEPELLEIARDVTVPLTRRGKAVVALQHYPSEAVRVALDELLVSGEPLLKRKAAYGLVGFGAAAVPSLTGALASADVQLRIAAANALGKVGDDTAKQAIGARLAVETEPAVKAALSAAQGGAQ